MTFLKCDVVGAFVVDSFIQSRHAWPALRRTWHQPEARYVSWP